jgi:hypothetical protein
MSIAADLLFVNEHAKREPWPTNIALPWNTSADLAAVRRETKGVAAQVRPAADRWDRRGQRRRRR